MSVRSIRWVYIPETQEEDVVLETLRSSSSAQLFASLRADAPCRWLRITVSSLSAAEALHASFLPFGRAFVSSTSSGEHVVLFEGSCSHLLEWCVSCDVDDVVASEWREQVEVLCQRAQTPPPVWKCKRGVTFDFSRARPYVMGIVNVTPDSFSDGGAFLRRERAVEHALRLIDEGVELLDIGGESTRPGALPVSAEEERERVIPVIQDLVDRGISVPISVDTYKASVADTALQEGADVVNDISMLRFDPQLADVVAAHGAYVMLMHSRHVPQDMQKQPHYHSLWGELLGELEDAISSAVGAGVRREHIAVDPGIGFGKRQVDNLRILRELPVLRSFGLPVVVGASRKSFIGRILDEPATQRLEGSLAAAAVSSIHGAHFIRVHDVAETSKLLRVLEAIRRPIFQ